MIISDEDRTTLVFNAYRQYELLGVGARMRVGEFEDHWRTSGLRQSDLQLTLSDLVGWGLLRAEPTASGMAYFLTESGARYLQDHPETLTTRRALYQLARRPRGGGGLRPERRRAATA
ncbi:MAG: hypothetical protein NVS9B10_06880 [Nevskia sp.]